jgi:hypothetical protein
MIYNKSFKKKEQSGNKKKFEKKQRYAYLFGLVDKNNEERTRIISYSAEMQTSSFLASGVPSFASGILVNGSISS